MSVTKLHAGGNGDNSGEPPLIPDAADIEALWMDPALGDGIVDTLLHNVPAGKPRDFFRTHPDHR
jgi:hypothetical protein